MESQPIAKVYRARCKFGARPSLLSDIYFGALPYVHRMEVYISKERR